MKHPGRIAVATVTLAITAVYLPALLGGAFFLDVYLTEVHPAMVELGRQLDLGHLAFWTDRIQLGYPLASNPQIGALYPPHLLLAWLVDADRAIVWSAWFHTLLAGLGTLALARKSGASPTGATAAALIYACSPFLLFYHQALHGLVALGLLPIILTVTWLASERRSLRLFALGAVLLALQMYAGHLQFVTYTLIATLPIAWHAGGRRAAALSVAQGTTAVLLYGPQLLAAFQLWRLSLRHSLGATDITAALNVESLGLDDLVEAILPRWYGGPRYTDFWYPEYVGAAVLILALIGLRKSRLFTGLLAATLLYLVLIRVPHLGSWLMSIPGLSAFRAPGRVLALALLALAILAGHGVDAVSGRRSEVAIWALFVAIGLAALLWPHTTAQAHTDALQLLLACGGLAVAWRLRRWRALLVVATVWPVVWVGARYLPTIPPPKPSPALRFLQSRAYRVLGVSAGDPAYMAAVPGPDGWPSHPQELSRAGWTLPSNVAMAQGLRNLHAQTSLPLHRFVTRLLGPKIAALGYPLQAHPPYAQSLLAHLGVTHVVSRRNGQMPVQPRPRAVFQRQGIVVHALSPRAPVRFYPNSLVWNAQNQAQALARTRRDGPLPDIPLIAERYTQGTATKTTHGRPLPVLDIGHYRATLTAKEAGVLLWPESYYPDWTATVDDRPAPVIPVDGALLGVPVPAGHHTVRLRYVPRAFLYGLPALALGLLLVLGALWRQPRATRQTPAE